MINEEMKNKINLSDQLQDVHHNNFNYKITFKTMKEHSKFIGVLNTRLNYLKPITHWWNSGNIKSSIYAVEKYIHLLYYLKYVRISDTTVLMDILNMLLITNKIQNLSIEYISVLIPKSLVLIESKY